MYLPVTGNGYQLQRLLTVERAGDPAAVRFNTLAFLELKGRHPLAAAALGRVIY
ncbi:hypothetical protein D3C80_2127500 [compost metagenome]